VKRKSHCLNFNHGRPNAPVRYCPMCGEVVNDNIPVQGCSEEKHAQRRRQNAYCVDCGVPLVQQN